MRVKIKKIDHDGFCGRDNHPTDGDVGLIGQVYAVKSELSSMLTDISESEVEYTPEIVLTEDVYLTVYYEVVMPDKSLRTLVDHEIEVLK